MPRIEAETVVEHREALRRRVFDAFAALMAERGYDGISMAQIAARADLGRTAIYHHFPDKERLLVAFATDETDRYLCDLEARLAGVTDPEAALRCYIRHQLESGDRFHMGLGRQDYGELAPATRMAIRDHVLAVEAVLRKILADGATAGVFVEIGEADIGLIHGCLAPRRLDPAEVESFVVRAVSVR